ncbi:MAG: nucleotide exchange factor GrpE [Muribaculaceae bacterium]|nr:nucleotide exchange factor GrpE [Muribaculaceae bacterium]
MSKKEDIKNEETVEEITETAENGACAEETAEEQQVEPTPEEHIATLEAELEKEKREYMFLMAEFDNFRKRTLREKAEIIQNGAENAMRNILPIIDDFDRAIQATTTSEDVAAVREGVELIYNKFIKYLESNGVKEMITTGENFDADIHEAVTTFPAPSEDLKGKIIDTVQKGYSINDKVLRHAKVVVGQ